MKKNLFIIALLMGVAVGGSLPSMAQSASKDAPENEIRIWTAASGETIEGEYVRLSGKSVVIQVASGKRIEVPLSQLSDEDRLYVEYKNPPELEIVFKKSLDAIEYLVDEWYSADGTAQSSSDPATVVEASFGAKVSQKRRTLYNHDLFIEIYALTEQRYDPKKKHLIAHIKSGAFRLNEENKFTYDYMNEDIYRILKYNTRIDGSVSTADWIRGEEYSDMLVLVRDENGNIVGYNATGDWLYKYLDRLEELPVNAWMNRECVQVHPTSVRYGE
ncbi:MAG: hypothetical protein JXR23_01255 [Pontiellaceae bacterium]|nr:hypothetical protein [Pontiellaceae bacterium]